MPDCCPPAGPAWPASRAWLQTHRAAQPHGTARASGAPLYVRPAGPGHRSPFGASKWPWPHQRTCPAQDQGIHCSGGELKCVLARKSLVSHQVRCAAQDRGIDRLVGRTKFAEADDVAILEDEGARVVLRGDCLPTERLVTGVSLAVRGSAAPGGDHFQVMVGPALQLASCVAACTPAWWAVRLRPEPRGGWRHLLRSLQAMRRHAQLCAGQSPSGRWTFRGPAGLMKPGYKHVLGSALWALGCGALAGLATQHACRWCVLRGMVHAGMVPHNLHGHRCPERMCLPGCAHTATVCAGLSAAGCTGRHGHPFLAARACLQSHQVRWAERCALRRTSALRPRPPRSRSGRPLGPTSMWPCSAGWAWATTAATPSSSHWWWTT